MSLSLILFYAVLLVITIVLPSQAAYILNAEFGGNGITITGFDNYDDRANAIALQKDGRIVVAGQSDNGSDTDIAVARYNSDGSLDNTFNGDGKATFKIGSGNDGAYGVVVQDDGSIVVAGYTMEGEQQNIALIRLTSTGYLDLDFGIAGQAVLVQGDSDAEARHVLIDKENHILVGGTIQTAEKKWAVTARFLFDGSIDETFGDQGIRRIEKGESSAGNVIAQQSDGRIVVGGTSGKDGGTTAALFRLDENGSIDESFGAGGVAVLNSSADNSAVLDMIVLADDSVVATGYSTADEKKSITTAKFSGNGIIDGTFGSNGLSAIELENDSVAYSIAEKQDGTFVVIGEGPSDSNSDIILVYLNSNGLQKSSTTLATVGEIREAQAAASGTAKEPLWDENVLNSLDEYELIATRSAGVPLITDIDNEDDFGRAVIVQLGGKVFAAGYTFNGRDEDFALINYADDAEADSLSSSDDESVPYYIYTTSVSNVSRNSAMTGGVITENKYYDCETEVGEDCTVTARGVVYGVTSYPVYRTDGESTSSTTEEESSSSGVFPDWTTDTSYNYELVRSGQTSDGTGTGEYGSDITQITPNTLYYVRAYAVLDDGTVYYGNQLSFKSEDACFIATAAYGSSLEKHVMVLRQFRDRYLQTNDWGRGFVRLYYQYSPPLADFISQSRLLRSAVQLALLPLVSLSYFLLYTSLQVKILCMMLVVIAFPSIKLLLLRRQNQ